MMRPVDSIQIDQVLSSFIHSIDLHNGEALEQLFRINTAHAVTLKICSLEGRKLRFIDSTLAQRLEEIKSQEITAKIDLLVKEIHQGRAILEEKQKNGQRHVIASPDVAKMLEEGELHLKGKKGDIKKIDQIHVASLEEFQKIAKKFEEVVIKVVEQKQDAKKNERAKAKSTELTKAAVFAHSVLQFFDFTPIIDHLSKLISTGVEAVFGKRNSHALQESYYQQAHAEIKEARIEQRKQAALRQLLEKEEIQRYERKRDDLRHDIARYAERRSVG